jgi:hypothetical protein
MSPREIYDRVQHKCHLATAVGASPWPVPWRQTSEWSNRG